ncbi:MAG: glycosyltransferase [Holosporaceae bacterium]|jgi:glycosyltransferase involved in cell wall biosynthesis|nr:glycosyltransferase [Holosporaceae bacterium]
MVASGDSMKSANINFAKNHQDNYFKVAVLIPCYNESSTIASVVGSFSKQLPNATIYVYDNDSEDGSAEIAKKAGAIVMSEQNRGKGNVVRKMFSEIDADIYIIADGDSTYAPEDAPKMINLLINEKVDMVVAVRKEESEKAFRNGHKIGNKLFNFMLKILFNSTFNDVFSGYRAFSRRFVKTFPIAASGFDIEAELSIHALTLSIPFTEMESIYTRRPENSHSKLSTISDGFKILFSIIRLLKETRPMFFFGTISLVLCLLACSIAFSVILTFLETGVMARLPIVALSFGIMMISFLSLTCGIILDSISEARKEMKRLHYLRI